MTIACSHGSTRSRCPECVRTYNRDYARKRRRRTCKRGHPLRRQGLRRGVTCHLCAKAKRRAANARCKFGHPRTKENFREYGGRRQCVLCARSRQNEYAAKNRKAAGR